MFFRQLKFAGFAENSAMPPSKQPRKPHDTEEILRQVLPVSGEIARSSLGRMVDMKIPLWGILTGLDGVGWVLISMWFSVQQTNVAVAEMQVTLKAGNNQVNANAIEIATIKLRLDNAERAYRDVQQQMSRPYTSQGGRP